MGPRTYFIPFSHSSPQGHGNGSMTDREPDEESDER